MAERRRREDASPRLLAEVPELTGLSLAIEEHRPSGGLVDAGHTRRIVVQSAPALFVVPCTVSSCHGQHDVTQSILRELRRRAARFEGEASCDECGCSLRYVATATYRAQDAT